MNIQNKIRKYLKEGSSTIQNDLLANVKKITPKMLKGAIDVAAGECIAYQDMWAEDPDGSVDYDGQGFCTIAYYLRKKDYLAAYATWYYMDNDPGEGLMDDHRWIDFWETLWGKNWEEVGEGPEIKRLKSKVRKIPMQVKNLFK